ncbi:hypothetical protein KSP40_PGU000262 [Platanthera guangdongensis]|uniref:Uncharacterized protein n=1 Tax=Platanthera guangdongensis TaxID=2320717 RepID=A0ABR2MSS0_9ASPA
MREIIQTRIVLSYLSSILLHSSRKKFCLWKNLRITGHGPEYSKPSLCIHGQACMLQHPSNHAQRWLKSLCLQWMSGDRPEMKQLSKNYLSVRAGRTMRDVRARHNVHRACEALYEDEQSRSSVQQRVESFVKIFPGTAHGWTVRYDVNDESAVAKAEEAHADMIGWFTKHLLKIPKAGERERGRESGGERWRLGSYRVSLSLIFPLLAFLLADDNDDGGVNGEGDAAGEGNGEGYAKDNNDVIADTDNNAIAGVDLRFCSLRELQDQINCVEDGDPILPLPLPFLCPTSTP